MQSGQRKKMKKPEKIKKSRKVRKIRKSEKIRKTKKKKNGINSEKVTQHRAVINDSPLFLRFMKKRITRTKFDHCHDFIVLKFITM